MCHGLPLQILPKFILKILYNLADIPPNSGKNTTSLAPVKTNTLQSAQKHRFTVCTTVSTLLLFCFH